MFMVKLEFSGNTITHKPSVALEEIALKFSTRVSRRSVTDDEIGHLVQK